jgi:hypothetical protein
VDFAEYTLVAFHPTAGRGCQGLPRPTIRARSDAVESCCYHTRKRDGRDSSLGTAEEIPKAGVLRTKPMAWRGIPAPFGDTVEPRTGRNPSPHLLDGDAEAGRGRFSHGGLDESGRDRVRGDAERSELDRERPVKPWAPTLAADQRDTVRHTRHIQVPFRAVRFRGTPITVLRNGR